ncbi:NAD(P)/FAD-dependent oxidoreductase [Rhizobium sp. FKY42]|uniref:flavin-containing monooxygenase n=1 Tax=Rhizobium sp. FKY42 TaxID=2562310 RepID=UPI001FEF9721|nr:NAD(P)/FAD-dependent oxidoreductase [Rhizobium sp. FKY42]
MQVGENQHEVRPGCCDGLAETPAKEEVLARYAEEREKRLAADRHYVSTPIKGERATSRRSAVRSSVTVAIIGGGFAGLIAGARLREVGIGSIRIIERGNDVGGTWHWNRYPGAQSDTAAMVYLPLLEETGHIPSEKYVHGPEIRSHCKTIARHYNLYDDALFGTSVKRMRWEEASACWSLETDRGDRFNAQFVVFAVGQFHEPRLPAIPGLERFKGHLFHTSQWDYEYTGGTPDGSSPMALLATQRVGLIGTGATAVQCVPHLARAAQQLLVFQRTPSAVDERNNLPISAEWFTSIATPGWQQRWLDNFVEARNPISEVDDLVRDGWTQIAQRVRDRLKALPGGIANAKHVATLQSECDLENMSRIRDRIARIVKCAKTAEQLLPWYFQFCKRPCFHDDYLEAFNLPSTFLVDTGGKGVEAVTESGVVANGQEYQLDALIFATGFSADNTERLSRDIIVEGRDGHTLGKAWTGGMKTYHGIHVSGFPNAFHVQPAQGANFLSNITHNLLDGAAAISAIVEHMVGEQMDIVEVSEEAQTRWISLLKSGQRSLASDACTPGNFNNDGKLDDPGFRLSVGYPDGPGAYFRYSRNWRSNGRFEGLEFRRAGSSRKRK